MRPGGYYTPVLWSVFVRIVRAAGAESAGAEFSHTILIN